MKKVKLKVIKSYDYALEKHDPVTDVAEPVNLSLTSVKTSPSSLRYE